jgi:uncharacterized protein with FMN-binding domain
VYAAGYFKTRPAAQHFAEEAVARHPVARATGIAQRAAEPPHTLRPPSLAPRSRSGGTPRTKPAAQQTIADSTPAAAPAPATPAPSALLAQDPAAASTAPTVATAPAAGSTAPAPDTASHSPDKPLARWKDGVYMGWGTSRHGDIQASVEIQNGRIASATITQCLTRYSCSWIAALPPQVVARQGAEVDYVSGATQSTDAFYTAIVEALKLAK